jgi:hypothetical protein
MNSLENISNIDDGKLRYNLFVKVYNEAREESMVLIHLSCLSHVDLELMILLQVYNVPTTVYFSS